MSERPPKYFTLTPKQLEGYVIDEEFSKSKPPKATRRKELGAVNTEMRASIETLQQALTQRAADFHITPPNLELPSLPLDFTEKHLAALKELFGEDNLEATACPKPEELTDGYFQMMYPQTQKDEDKRSGLKSFQPDWWAKTADEGFSLSEAEAKRTGQRRATWGELFCKSMRAEAAQMNDVVLFSETIPKPKFKNGQQHYGTAEGTDATKDSLLPLIQGVFGSSANRFNLTWDQINQQLIPKLKEKLTEILATGGLALPANLDIICTPAFIANLQTTLKHQADSQTDTFDWTSTPLLNQEDKDSGCRLMVGASGYGGGGCVNSSQRVNRWSNGGFRLSVVLKKS